MTNKVYVRTNQSKRTWIRVKMQDGKDGWLPFTLNKQDALTLANKLVKAANQMDHIQLTDNVIPFREIEIT